MKINIHLLFRYIELFYRRSAKRGGGAVNAPPCNDLSSAISLQ